MKAILLALLVTCSAAQAASPKAASPEADYLAARDRDIAALAKLENAKDPAPGDAKLEKALADLQRRMTALIGHVAVAGFPATGKINLESLFAHDEGFGMLDGLAFGDSEGDKTLVVSTDGLLDAWLAAHAKPETNDPPLPRDPSAAAKTALFYTWAVSTGSAAVHYAEIPVVAPARASVAQAMLSARTQDMSPQAPDRLFVVLARDGRVFIVEEALATAMTPIAACDAVTARYTAEAEAADKAYDPAHPPKDPKAADRGVALRDEGDAAFRACYGEKVKGSAAFAAATAQAKRIIDALTAGSR